jgi:hypothetical protein
MKQEKGCLDFLRISEFGSYAGETPPGLTKENWLHLSRPCRSGCAERIQTHRAALGLPPLKFPERWLQTVP